MHPLILYHKKIIMKRKVALICAQPSIPYFAWQLEVMLTNFVSLGIHEKHEIQILCAYNKKEKDWMEKVATMQKVATKFEKEANFFFYEDKRKEYSYISAVRPNILRHHFWDFPELEKYTIFYHDCDIAFTEYPLFLDDADYINDKINYVSDTRSYLNYDYIISKGENVFNKMCEIINIDPEIIKKNNDNAGGAQYLLKNINWLFWSDVEDDCKALFTQITELNNQLKKENPTYHELQIWCADMWAIAWNLWKGGDETKIIPELDFCWATDNKKRWAETFIFHNAGITHEGKDKSFYKGLYTDNYPYLLDGQGYDKNSCSYKYFEIIKSIGANSCLL